MIIDWLIDRNHNSQCFLLFIILGFCQCRLQLIFNLELFKLKINKIFFPNFQDDLLLINFEFLISNFTNWLNSWNGKLNVECTWNLSSSIHWRVRVLHELTIVYWICKNAWVFWPLDSFAQINYKLILLDLFLLFLFLSWFLITLLIPFIFAELIFLLIDFFL